MANTPMKSIKLPGLEDTYTFLQIDATLTQTGKAADAKATGDAVNELKSQLDYIADDIDTYLVTDNVLYKRDVFTVGVAERIREPTFILYMKMRLPQEITILFCAIRL